MKNCGVIGFEKYQYHFGNGFLMFFIATSGMVKKPGEKNEMCLYLLLHFDITFENMLFH